MTGSHYINSEHIALEIFHNPETNKAIILDVECQSEHERAILVSYNDPLEAGLILQRLARKALNELVDAEISERRTETFSIDVRA